MQTTVPPPTDLLVVTTKIKVELVTEDDILSHSMTLHTIAVFGDVGVVLRGVLHGATVCQWCWHLLDDW